MTSAGVVKVLFIAGFGPIVRDAASSRKLYAQDLGLAFKAEAGGYLHTEALHGAKTFALWPLEQAAQSCFGEDAWPEDLPVPQAWLEFDVDDPKQAAAGLEARGHRMLVRDRTEPWGQTVSRFLSPEGLLTAVTFTPALREAERTDPPVRTTAKAKIVVQSSAAEPYDQSSGSALAEIHLTEIFSGDIEGESPVRALQVRRDDRSAHLVSLQRVSGTLHGHPGAFVLQGAAMVEDGRIKASWFVVPGSGTEDLVGLRGEGGFEGEFGKGSDGTLDYWFE